MRWTPQTRGLPILAAVSFGIAAACARWGTTAPLLALAPTGWYILSDTLAMRRRPEFCVYLLRAESGETLYVGSTNDVERRALEHTSPAHHEPWRVRIHSVTDARWCHTQRQALRIERRMIRALTVAADNGWCDRLHNETWAAPPSGAKRLWAWVWSLIYLCQSCLWSHCCWHRKPQDPGYVIPKHDPFEDDSWEHEQTVFAGHEPSRSAPVTRNALALGPVTLEEGLSDYVRETPPKRDSPSAVRDSGEGGEEEGTRKRQPRLGHMSAEEQAARRRAQNAERQRRHRAQRKGEGS